ncbi:MAG: PAS domain-containing protein [Patescibacteria group bacterium]|nr:PAS domain-containing protein [Patescibacteria group bacterium]
MKKLPTDKIISCFYDSSEDCVKVVNTDGMLMSFNPNGLKVMEIDDEKEVLGQEWLSFWRGDLQNEARTALATAKRGKLAKFEGYCPTYKGTMKYWKVSIAPLFDDFGGINWLLVMSRDATKQIELEKQLEALKQENKRLKKQQMVPQQTI